MCGMNSCKQGCLQAICVTIGASVTQNTAENYVYFKQHTREASYIHRVCTSVMLPGGRNHVADYKLAVRVQTIRTVRCFQTK